MNLFSIMEKFACWFRSIAVMYCFLCSCRGYSIQVWVRIVENPKTIYPNSSIVSFCQLNPIGGKRHMIAARYCKIGLFLVKIFLKLRLNVVTLNEMVYIWPMSKMRPFPQSKRIEEEIHQTKPFPNDQTKALINVIFTASWLESQQAQLLKPFGISIQQYNILRILKGMRPKPATVKLLIERMIDKNSNASRLVDKLLKKGLVERHACQEDRRRVDVFITDEGLKVIEEVAGTMQDNPFLKQLTNEEAIQLSDLLDKMRGV